MTLEEYEHMYEVYRYVYSAPPNTPERERRLAEISREDDEKLWDFYSGLCSGRIKRPEETSQEREENNMNIYDGKVERIQSYADFKRALTKTSSYKSLCALKNSNPQKYEDYQKRLEAEKEGK